jgi:hypothetical protein
MTLRRATMIGAGLVLVLTGEALAQVPPGAGMMQTGAPPPQSGPPPMQAAPMGAPPGGGAPPCMSDFVPLRQEAERRAGLIKVAAARKAGREEICQLITKFSEAEGKFAKFVEANQTWCAIPANVVVAIKANHGRTMRTRAQVCSGNGAIGAQGPSLPPGPGLSDTLGLNRAPTATNTMTGKGGTYDTLSGNPIK